MLLARRLDQLWGTLSGRLMANGGRALRFNDNVRDVLNLVYYTSVEWMDEKQRTEFDGHVTVTAEMLSEFENDKREQRMNLIMSLGEVNDNAGIE